MIFNRYLDRNMKLVCSIISESLLRRNFHCSQQSFLAVQRITQFFARYSSTVPFKLGDIGEGIRDVELKEWYVEIGDEVKEFDKICEVQSDKANFTITSRYAGTIMKLYHHVNGTAIVGKPLVDIQLPPGIDLASKKKKTTIMSEDFLNKPSLANILATPAVRQLAKELRISLNEIQGSGKDGRILTQDLIDFRADKTNSKRFSSLSLFDFVLQEGQKKALSLLSNGIVAPPSPASVKQSMIPRSSTSVSSANAISNSHITFCDQYDLTKLIRLRHQSFLSFIIKACSQVFARYPMFNSLLPSKKADQIGITIPTGDGFVLTKIPNVEQLSIVHIENELLRLQQLAQTNQLPNEDLSQSTFLLATLGQIGGTYSIPVIHSPQLVIGSLGKITKQALPNDDEECHSYEIRSMMSITWSTDNRVIDGRTIVKFSDKLKFLLENPYEILLY